MKRRVIAIVAAVVLAIAGAGLILVYVKGADSRAVADAQPVYVYVADELVPAGTTLKDAERTELVSRTKVAQGARPAGAIEWIGPDNNAQLALSDVQPGEFLMASRFGATPVGEKAIEVPPGKVAMSVQLSDPARVGEFVTPGSEIAIYATHKIKLVGDDDKTKQINELDLHGTTVLLPKVQVIAMGTDPLAAPDTAKSDSDSEDSTASGSQSNDVKFLVTVAVDPADAPRLAHGVSQYTLYAGLRGPDAKIAEGDDANDLSIFDGQPSDLLKDVKP
ncbi:Flp pilus assembly protein CpaB [Janibacter sp. G349]|jgi:pilus assembly protein CpaB|uniref:Flp pilus assembly protein CpaB n=1 Tax=unclassified Janibacter TaxID=2649294 RepID=UPI003B80D579